MCGRGSAEHDKLGLVRAGESFEEVSGRDCEGGGVAETGENAACNVERVGVYAGGVRGEIAISEHPS